ncbi:MAG: 23S rRNA (guanosine(2251)-2'-O)-methyltransferase RlmB [Anaerovoracaceae bacterium]|nr:23S rRNA (guanosine(2251)-2'-O)-methyltransferase RlmB [Anaerovoracaceae bacterium]
MAKVKNKRENHNTKRGRYYAERGREMPGRDSRGGRPKPEGNGKTRRIESAGRTDFEKREETPDGSLIIGRNPVMEALKSGREIDKLMVSSREGSMIKILAMAKEQSVPVIMVEKAALDRIAAGRPHQGVVAYVSPYAYSELEDVFSLAEKRGEDPFLVLLDNLEDPHNLGAIMRTAECAGAHGILIPRRHACGLTEVVAKASAGAVEYMPVVKVTNMAQTVEELKSRGIWTAACDMGGKPYYQANLSGPLAVVIGSEGAGISKLVREKCDFVVSMPMVGHITSLNASNAAAVIMYEVRKQRDGN